MDQLVEANTTINEVEEEDSRTCANGGLLESNEEDENTMLETQSLKENMIDEEEEGLELVTPRTTISSNDVSNTPKEVGFARYV
jgi:hypothetical protein